LTTRLGHSIPVLELLGEAFELDGKRDQLAIGGLPALGSDARGAAKLRRPLSDLVGIDHAPIVAGAGRPIKTPANPCYVLL
jgi:hypothetical protein